MTSGVLILNEGISVSKFEKEKSRGNFSRRDHELRFFGSTLYGRSGLGFLRCRGFLALCFELSELLGGKNSLCLLEECSPAFLGAACLHALGLPRFDLALLIGCEVQCCQVNACRFLSVRHAFGTTRFVSCERAGCEEHCSRN